jgi:adenylate cyclase
MIRKAMCLANEVIFGWTVRVTENKKQAMDLIDKALSKSSGSAIAHTVKGTILMVGQPVEALAEYNLALEIIPNFHPAHAGKAMAFILSGRAPEAQSPLQLALRISPRHPAAFLWVWELCAIHLQLQQYKEAIEQCRRSISMNNSYWQAYPTLISAYGSTGQMDQARQALSELDKRYPNLTVQRYRQLAYAVSTNPQYRREVDDILDGLRKGGVPEQ